MKISFMGALPRAKNENLLMGVRYKACECLEERKLSEQRARLCPKQEEDSCRHRPKARIPATQAILKVPDE